jgi:Flp pilus assembly protein TadD
MFERSVSIKPNADAYSNFGTVQFFQGRYADALKSFEEAIRLGRDTYEIWGNLADCYRYTPGYGAKAKEAYQKTLALADKERRVNPQEALLLARMAYYHAMSGDAANALSELREARKILPGSVLILKKCVQVLEKIGRRAEALEALREYLKKDGSLEEIEKDPDLSELRKDPGYEKTVAGVPAGKKGA